MGNVRNKPELQHLGPVTCYALYVVRGGRKDGWFVGKRWEGAMPAMYTRPRRKIHENIENQEFPLDYEGIAKEMR